MENCNLQQTPAQALVKFTGYYTTDVAVGAFVMIDTNLTWIGGDTQYTATITLCPDGQTSNKYTPGPNCTFDGHELLITNSDGSVAADLFLTDDDGVSTLSGTIGGNPVNGTTPFGPVLLSTWQGTYYQQGQVQHHGGLLYYPYTAMLQVNGDGSIDFAPPNGTLQPVQSYWYDFGMFVISLAPEFEYMFEMGTASGWGRVAGNAHDGDMLVSVQLQQPAPQL